MKIITESDIELLRNDINAALAAVAAKHNINLEVGNIRYSKHNAEIKVQAATKETSGVVITKEVQDLRMVAKFGQDGLPTDKDPMTISFLFRGESYTLCGYKSRNRKFPYLAKNNCDGKTYKFTASSIRNNI